MTSKAGLLFLKIRSNCSPALLGRRALSSPAQGLAIYISVAPRSLPSFSRHVPCDPSLDHYPALGWSGMEKLPLALPSKPTSGSLICQTQAGGRFPEDDL